MCYKGLGAYDGNLEATKLLLKHYHMQLLANMMLLGG